MGVYQSYKSSGIEWIGDIPGHWEMVKLKYLGKSLIGLSYQPEDIVEDETEGILVLRSSNIQNGKLSMEDNVYVKCRVKQDIIVRQGDILVCSRNGSRSLIGKNITIDEKLEGNTFGVFMTVFRTPHYQFISKVFNSKIFTNQSGLFLTSTINQLTQDTLNNFVIPFSPNEEEQLQIVQFLDNKTEIIDKLISIKEKKIELLKEQRKSLINKVVTKGIDQNVKMRDTGVEWIGDIPEHWKSVLLRYILNPVREKSEKGDEELLSVTIKNGVVRRRDYLEDDFENITRSETLVGYIKCTKGNLVNNIMKMGFYCLGISPYDGIVSPGYSVFEFMDENNYPRYWDYLLKTEIYVSQYRKLSKGIQQSRMRLYDDYFLSIHSLLPPYLEQQQIVDYLDEQTKEIDDLISLEQRKIDLLKEYRQSLISEVITGKIDVRLN